MTTLHFSRFEFKYVLPKSKRDEVESELKYFLTLDPYVDGKPNKKYFVRSLYFDDAAFTHYYEKIDGMLDRTKFRVRTYTSDPTEGCATFLEIKGKYNALVYKHRSPFKDLSTESLLIKGDNMISSTLKNTEESPTLNQFNFEVERKGLSPVVLIDYFRRPYISKYAPDFRLTFDDTLTGTRTRSLFPSKRDSVKAILRGYTVMEVKFNHHIPSWFHRIVQSYELRRVSISKYCKGVEIFNLTPSLE